MKKCPKCNQMKELDEFCKDKNRKDKHSSWCKICSKERMKKWRSTNIDYNTNYYLTNKVKEIFRSYKYRDNKKGFKNDLTLEWLINNIFSKSCEYCGDIYDIGADRIDNSKGHTMDNCIPCCWQCNMTRSDRFSYEEMKNIIGPAIKLVKQKRNLNNESVL